MVEFFSDLKRAVVVGVGNEFRGDDYLGVKVVKELSDKLRSRKVLLLNGENIPENWVNRIIEFRPTHVLLIDAGMVGMKPGQAALVDVEKLTAAPVLSTHALPLRVLCELVREVSGARVAVLVIQPKDTSLRRGLTQELEEASKRITEILLDVLRRRIESQPHF